MFDRFFERIGWKKKTDDIIVDSPMETLVVDPPKEEASKPQPFVIPDPALTYKIDETYVPAAPRKKDPLVAATAKELSKKPLKKKKPVADDVDKIFADLLRKLSEEDKPKKSKKKAVRKTVKKKSKK